MQRILKNSATTIRNTFYSGEEPIDSDDPVTVEVVRDNGDVVVPAGTATTPGAVGSGTASLLLTPAHSSLVDILTARWTATLNGQEMTLETQVEVVGGFYFTLAAARASDDNLISSTKYTTERIVEARDEVEDECETITKVAWVERYRRVTLSGAGRRTLVLPDSKVRQVRQVLVDGEALEAPALEDMWVGNHGILTRRADLFPEGRGNIEVVYTHGYDQPPSDIRRAALIRLRNLLYSDTSGIPDRATSFVAGPGGTFHLATAGKGSSETGIPDVDAVYGRHVHVRPVFA